MLKLFLSLAIKPCVILVLESLNICLIFLFVKSHLTLPPLKLESVFIQSLASINELSIFLKVI